jgi:hypothetical protein
MVREMGMTQTAVSRIWRAFDLQRRWSPYTYRRTGSYLPGALLSGALVAWYVVVGQADAGRVGRAYRRGRPVPGALPSRVVRSIVPRASIP